jgi:site-specific DNA-methyltransferase (adenine-specific)
MIHHGECLETMRGMADASVDAVVTDPPFFNVVSADWDRQWASRAKFLAWFGELVTEWHRLIRPNGSLYVFAYPRMAAAVETVIGEKFNVLNQIVWRKTGHAGKRNKTTNQRAFWPATERIVFAEHFGGDNMARGLSTYAAKCDEARAFVFEPLRAYLVGEMERAGWDKGKVNAAWRAERGGNGGMAGHWFSRSQWELPTAKNYEWLRGLFNGDGADHLRREYEDLRREYEDLRREYEDLRREYESLRRPFAVSRAVQWEDVWEFAPVQRYPGKHTCEKPDALMRHIVASSTRPGALILDPFAGSGATGVAALSLGRRFVGIEKDAHWHGVASERCAAVEPEPANHSEPPKSSRRPRARIAAPDMFATGGLE